MTVASLGRRAGFTLAEVLVTIAIIAIMAAVILPALNQQLSKGDVSRLSSDLTNIQSAVQAFVSDVRRYPSSTTQLISGATGNDINGIAIPSTLAAKWKGPYLGRDVLSNTGFGAGFNTAFSLTSSSTVSYLTASVSPITPSDFQLIEETLDEGTPSTTSSTAGSVRYSSGGSILSYLLMPIQ